MSAGDDFICERECRDDSDELIIVRLGRPVKVGDGEYQCAFQLQGVGSSPIQHAHGTDCFQALQLAMEGIRTGLDRSGRSFSWEGGEAGDPGFPRMVPAFYGQAFSQRVNRMIDEEVERFARQAQERSAP